MVESESSSGWSCDMEVNLFHAMRGHKPVGVNRYFQMVLIHEKMQTLYKKLTTKQIWDGLADLYDLQALNESEIVPFPNKENEFTLPESDFLELKEKSFPRLIITKPPEESKSETRQEKQEKPEINVKPSKSDSRHSMGTPSSVVATPDNSPKRKRTRHTPSSTASPATPDAPPIKRRR